MTELRPTMTDSADCPFVHCTARVTIVHEQSAPGPTAGPHVNRVKPHSIAGPFEWWGACPGSLMALPLSDAAQAALADFAASVERSAARRQADEAAHAERQGRTSPPDPQHSKTPRPDAKPYWFRNSG